LLGSAHPGLHIDEAYRPVDPSGYDLEEQQ
jgi:hypothetical protein